MSTCCGKIKNPCPVYPDAHCVVYTGQSLSCIGASSNERLDDILEKINSALCNTTPGDTLEFNNGLTRTDDLVQLGGALVKNTEINLSGYCLSLVGVEEDLNISNILGLTTEGCLASTTTDQIIALVLDAVSADNGLTENTPGNIQLGGTLLKNTLINQNNFTLSFTNSKTGFNLSGPTHTISIGDESTSSPVIDIYAPNGTVGFVENRSIGQSLAIRSGSTVGIYPRKDGAAGQVIFRNSSPTGGYIASDWYTSGQSNAGEIGLQGLEPLVSNEFYIKAKDDNGLIGYLALYDRIVLRNIPNDNTVSKIIGIDADDNVRYIDSAAISGSTTIHSTTLSGTGLATSFNIPHGITGTPKAIVMEGSSDATGIDYITIDSTNITVHYTIAPSSGTNNLTYYWIASL